MNPNIALAQGRRRISGTGWDLCRKHLGDNTMTYTYKLARRMAMLWVGRCTVGLVLLVVAFFVGWTLGAPLGASGAVPGINPGPLSIPNLELPPSLVQWLVVWFGSLAGHVFRFQGEFTGAKDFLRQVFPNRSMAFYARVDLWVSSTMGSVLGMIIIAPATPYTQLVTGLAWPFLVRGAIGAIKGIAGRGNGHDLPPPGPELHLAPVPRSTRGRKPAPKKSTRDVVLASNLGELPPAA
jgi:hypothetical protein